MDIRFRRATLNDLKDLLRIKEMAINIQKENNTLQWSFHYPNENTFLNDIEKGFSYVATINDVVVSYAALCYGVEPMYLSFFDGFIDNTKDASVIHRVMVSKDYLNLKIATKLISFLIKESKSNVIRIDTSDTNFAMKKVIKNLNFKYIASVELEDKTTRKVYEITK